MVHISYWLTGDLDERQLEGVLDQLSAEERARRARLVFAEDRRDFAAAHLLLRHMLSTYGRPHDGQAAFERGPHGKPYLADDTGDSRLPSFNLAHTRGLVASVVTHNVEVGIDVEPLNRGGDALELARRYFSVAEVRDLERCGGVERDMRFTELWTLKEAFVKATGTGIANELRGYGFTFDGSASLVFAPADGAQADAWAFALFDVGGYRLAVAVRDAAENIEALSVRDHGRADVAGPSARLLRASPGLGASCSFL